MDSSSNAAPSEADAILADKIATMQQMFIQTATEILIQARHLKDFSEYWRSNWPLCFPESNPTAVQIFLQFCQYESDVFTLLQRPAFFAEYKEPTALFKHMLEYKHAFYKFLSLKHVEHVPPPAADFSATTLVFPDGTSLFSLQIDAVQAAASLSAVLGAIPPAEPSVSSSSSSAEAIVASAASPSSKAVKKEPAKRKRNSKVNADGSFSSPSSSAEPITPSSSLVDEKAASAPADAALLLAASLKE